MSDDFREANEAAFRSEGYLQMAQLMIDDQWEALADTQLDHDRRVRAFLTMTMILSMLPEERWGPTAEIIQMRLNGLPPITMINTIHVLADSMSTMLALGFSPPPGFGGAV